MGDIVICRRDQGASRDRTRHACGVETVVDRSWFFLVFRGRGFEIFKPAKSFYLPRGPGECVSGAVLS